MKSIILLLGFASSVFAVDTKELVELAKKPSNYDAQLSVQTLYKLKEDQKTERWEQWDGPSDGGHTSQMKVIRRIVEGGMLVEVKAGLDFNNPKLGDVIEITRSKDKKVGWLRWRLYANKEQKWVLESSWDGTEIRSGFIHWKVVSEFDGEGSEKNWRKGKVIKWVHERIDNQGNSVQAYSEPVAEDHITGIIYYSGSGISPPYR
jgi:hypothetical protein